MVTARHTDDCRALKNLEGILKGIAADHVVDEVEVEALAAWLEAHENLRTRAPFAEVWRLVEDILADGVIDDGERADLLDYCERYETTITDFDQCTDDLRELHGVLAGVAADGHVGDHEVLGLIDWLGRHDHLAGRWPYDDLVTLLRRVLADGRLDPGERAELFAFCDDFVERPVADAPCHDRPDRGAAWFLVSEAPVVRSLHGICERAPRIVFPERQFCFTGQMRSGPRRAMQALVTARHGTLASSVTRALDYLVIGADSSPAWAYGPYGRKIEKAMDYRRSGAALTIVAEVDFLSAVESCPAP